MPYVIGGALLLGLGVFAYVYQKLGWIAMEEPAYEQRLRFFNPKKYEAREQARRSLLEVQ